MPVLDTMNTDALVVLMLVLLVALALLALACAAVPASSGTQARERLRPLSPGGDDRAR